MRTAEFLAWAESRWPSELAEAWDNPGLISGNLEKNHQRVMLSVDITLEVVEQAIAQECTLLVAHHPLLMGGIETLREDLYKGKLLTSAIKNDVSLFAAHTNADVVENGVSDSLAKAIGLRNVTALDGQKEGHGRVGEVDKTTLADFIQRLRALLPETTRGISYIGNLDQSIETVALVAGSGMSFVDSVSADVFVTSDVKHHPALDFKQQARIEPRSLVEISHFAAESVWLEVAAEEIRALGLEAIISTVNTDAWDGNLK